jgi:hypothetical protein
MKGDHHAQRPNLFTGAGVPLAGRGNLDYGDYLHMVLVYVSLPLIAWILSGGLRRRQAGQQHIATIPVIVIRQTVEPPPLPPEIPPDDRPPADDDAQSFAA